MIENESEPEVTLKEGLMAVVIGMAAEKSIKTGTQVDISDIFDHQGNIIRDVSDLTV